MKCCRALWFGSILIPIFTLHLISCSKPEPTPPTVIPLAETQPATQPAVDRDALLSTYAKKKGIDPAKAKEEAVKQGVFEKFGQEELTAEEFAKWVSYMWSVDPILRIKQLEAMGDINDLFSKLGPKEDWSGSADESKKKTAAAGPEFPPRDVEIELAISRAILDQFQFQERVAEGLRDLGALNVSGMKAQDDCGFCETMMQELLALVAPPPEPTTLPSTLPATLPSTLPSIPPPPPPSMFPSSFLRSLLEREAFAQTQTPLKAAGGKTKAPASPPPWLMKQQILFKGIPAIKVAKAPLLLARASTFKLTSGAGSPSFAVLQSPFQAIIPQFSAIAAEQFRFKAAPDPEGTYPKRTVGEPYRSAVEQNVARLAALPSRDQTQWYEMSTGLMELLLVNKLSQEYVEPVGKSLPLPVVEKTSPTTEKPLPPPLP